MDTVEGQLPGSIIHHINDGFYYLRYQTINNTQYFRCKYWRQGCPSRAKISRDNVFCVTSGHNHTRDINQVEALRVRHVLLDRARNPNYGSVENVLNNVRDDHPIMEQWDRHQLYRAMTRARSQTLPVVQNFAELRMVLENQSYSWLTAYEEGSQHSGFRGSLQAPDGSHVLLFLSNKCEHFLMTVPSIFLIQTSTNINNQQQELITVATFWDRNVISLAWLLFESNNPETLSAGFSLLRTHSPTYHFSQAFCRRGELADAFQRVYPMVKIQSSLYDFINELKVNIQAESLGILLQNPHGLRIVKLCCAFLLLPKELMQIGLNHIVSEALSAGEEINTHSMHLFNFIEREWLTSDTLEINLCGNIEGTHYGSTHLALKLERDLLPANDLFFIIKYITTSMPKVHQKIFTVQRGSRLQNAVPIPIAAEVPLWNILRATGFPSESKAINILRYVSDKIMI